MFMSEAEARQTADNQNKDHAIPRFWLNSIVDEEATEKAGGVIAHKDVLYIEIKQPGIRGQTWNGKATQEHFDRFSGAHQRFLAGQETADLNGFAIKECPLFTPAEKDNLRVLGFLTVESLADAPDSALKGMGMRERSNKAQRFVEAMNGPAATAKRMESLDGRLAMLEEEVKEARASNKSLRISNTSMRKKLGLEDGDPDPE